MNKFRVLGLMAVAMAAVSFVACSDDDEPDMPTPDVVKVLSIITDRYESVTLSYDNNGRVTKAVTNGGSWVETESYTYSSDKIVKAGDEGSTATYKLENGLITEVLDYDHFKIEYENGVIKSWTSIKSDGSINEKVTFVWQDGDIASMESTHGISLNYTYGPDYDFGGISAFHQSNSLLFDDLDPILVMQGFFGKMPIHLLTGVVRLSGKNLSDQDEYKYTYVFDKVGYPEKMVEILDDGRQFTTSFSWKNK